MRTFSIFSRSLPGIFEDDDILSDRSPADEAPAGAPAPPPEGDDWAEPSLAAFLGYLPARATASSVRSRTNVRPEPK